MTPKSHKIDESEIKSFFDNSYFEKGLKYVVESLNFSQDLISIIDEKEIYRQEPLEGKTHKKIPITVLGPSAEYYKEKLNSFRDIHLLYESVAIEKAILDVFDIDNRKKRERDFDKLIDRSNENNSSTVLLFTGDNKKVLFTSDAGPEALLPVMKKYDLKNLDYLDVPQHGSKNNLTTAIINKLNPSIAAISCAEPYPEQFIVDQLKLGRTKVYSTKTHKDLRYSSKMNGREGYSPIVPL